MSDDVRIEKDSLGEVRVPRGALYGAQTQRAAENFPVSGQRLPTVFIRNLALVKRAAAVSNAALGLLPRDWSEAIQAAAGEVMEGRWDDQFVLDVYQTGSGTSTNMNANEVLARRANQILGRADEPIHPNDHVNLGQSSNDVIPTAMYVAACREIHTALIPALEDLAKALREKAEAFDGIVKSGRTHLMDATPVRLGQEFAGWARQVEQGIRRGVIASQEMQELALGGTATGTGINTHPDFARLAIEFIAEESGLPFVEATDHFEAQGGKDGAVAASGMLSTLAGSLTKVADDIRWLSSGPTSGLSEIRLPAVQPGSSIMPGKVNPVMAEALMMVAARVMGNHTTMMVAGSRGNLELNVMMPLMAATLLESISILSGGCRVFSEKCVAGIEADPERCRELLEKNPAMATALNPRIGYDRAAEIAKEAARTGESVRDVVIRRALIPEEELDDVLDVRGMTEGGLGPEE